MPNYKGHVAGGIATFFGLVYVAGKQHAHVFVLAQWFVFTILGALFPDVDIHSKGRKIFFRVLLAALIYFVLKQDFQACILVIAMGLIPFCVRHRGIFHNVWFIAACTAIPVIYAQMYHNAYSYYVRWDALFFGFGALSHLLLDFGLIRFFKRTFGL